MQEAWSNRSCGVLLHPTSLPSPYGIGDLGPSAARYIEWLAAAGVGWWQVLPLNPPGPANSPYSAFSAFAGSPWLISPDELQHDGLLQRDDLARVPRFPADRVDYGLVIRFKRDLLRRAFELFQQQPKGSLHSQFDEFCHRHAHWLEEYALYAALKHAHGDVAWSDWPRDLAMHRTRALRRERQRLAFEIALTEFSQFMFSHQLGRLRRLAEARGVRILGDVPIFVAEDSADVWSNPRCFLLDDNRRPTVVAGVPPDYFSKTGQLWGNPLYDWQHLRETGYRWWIERMRHVLQQVDAVRIDHFRGFAAHWEVPAGDEVASNGRWVKGPGREVFDALHQALGGLPLVAEDLGEITPDVIALRRQLQLPGMAVLQFGFSPQGRSTFIPYNHAAHQVVYTGTHDNNTTVGWFEEEASQGERDLMLRYAASSGRQVHWDMIRLAFASVGQIAIVPHQDLAGLGSEARMNTPGKDCGNWEVRITEEMLSDRIADRLAEMVWVYGRGEPKRDWRRSRL